MAPMPETYVETFKEALLGWTDERFVSREDIEALAMFGMYLVNLSEEDGWEYVGHSWRESGYLGCLVVKANRDGLPQVVFTNATSYVGSVRIFLRKLDAEVLEWRKDKFRS